MPRLVLPPLGALGRRPIAGLLPATGVLRTTEDVAPAAADALLATAARLDLTAGQLTLTVIVLSAPGRAPNAA